MNTSTRSGCVLKSFSALEDKETQLFEGLEISRLDDGLEVVEPDVLVDISSLAACFQDYGHHPLTYIINRLKPTTNTQPILLGNFAGTALDDIIHQPDADFRNMLQTSFCEQALQFCTCKGFSAEQFKRDAQQQVQHIRESVDILFRNYDRDKALLEPSFVCKQLGLKGRVDLMTDDLRLLVEQKSGKKWVSYREAHFVQVLLYYGVLRYNFQHEADGVDVRLLYSKYPAAHGLLDVPNNDELFREAIRLRNRIVALEIKIAREGFASVLPLLQPDVLLEKEQKADFFFRYIRPEMERVLQPLHNLTPQLQDYVERMVTFVYREQLAAVTLRGELPVLTGLRPDGSVTQQPDTVELKCPPPDERDWGEIDYRRGDAVYLYRYSDKPDVSAHILYKGVITRLTDDEITVRLNDPQHHPNLFDTGTFAIEHASSDMTTTTSLRSLMAFCKASPDKRDLLLGNREPRRDTSLKLSHSYHPFYDDILLRAKQSRDYFLLQGPPGTGKTSMALRFLVQEELSSPLLPPTSHLLLTAYTNRAVDEICGMLEGSGQDYLRLGNEASCDPRYADRLLSSAFADHPKLSDIRRRLEQVPIVVATTSTLQARPFILALKHFSLCIVDEASQILEPNIIGLLSSERIDRFILIGDHKQLPAVVQQADDDLHLHACRLSLFERLLQQEREAGRQEFTGILNHQGRMHPDIASFPNEMFYHSEQLQPVPCPHQLATSLAYQKESEDATDDLLKQHRVLFLPSTDEAVIVADLLRRIYRQIGADHFDADHSIGVIVTYRYQIAQIRQEMKKVGIPALLDISIDTVERYQGSQRDVIIYSIGAQSAADLEFLTSQCFEEAGRVIDRKLNVAMTRAREQLLMTGNADVLRRNDIFNELLNRYSI